MRRGGGGSKQSPPPTPHQTPCRLLSSHPVCRVSWRGQSRCIMQRVSSLRDNGAGASRAPCIYLMYQDLFLSPSPPPHLSLSVRGTRVRTVMVNCMGLGYSCSCYHRRQSFMLPAAVVTLVTIPRMTTATTTTRGRERTPVKHPNFTLDQGNEYEGEKMGPPPPASKNSTHICPKPPFQRPSPGRSPPLPAFSRSDSRRKRSKPQRCTRERSSSSVSHHSFSGLHLAENRFPKVVRTCMG